MKMWMCVLAMVAPGLSAQDGPKGEDVNSAIPIWFGQKDSVCAGSAVTWDYEVPVGGTFFLAMKAYNDFKGVKVELQVTAEGTPLLTTLPTQAGCVSGQVDSVTYSLRLIAVNLPDEVNIGGTRLCATCTVKPPIYSHLTDKLETALKTGFKAEACHDSQGQIFQVKLQR